VINVRDDCDVSQVFSLGSHKDMQGVVIRICRA
jgi:hypothetical protein